MSAGGSHIICIERSEMRPLSLQAANAPVKQRGHNNIIQQSRDKIQDVWYAAKASCSGLAGHLQGWLAGAWQWLLELWAHLVKMAQHGVSQVRQLLPKRTDTASG